MTDTLSPFPAIIDLSGYNERMRKTFLDKTFFLEKIDATVYVDYGCGPGEMIEFMHKLFPEYTFFGYDNNPDMIALAKARNIPKAHFFSDFAAMMQEIHKIKDRKKGLILSSVLHEVFHYNQKDWYNHINNHMHYFDYVIIRDMYYGGPEYPLTLEDFQKIVTYYLKNPEVGFVLVDFMKKFPMTTMKQLYHFLLKYTYLDNWERECAENYFSWTLDMTVETRAAFKTIYKNSFYLPHIREKVKKDFGIDMQHNTHIKLILEKQ